MHNVIVIVAGNFESEINGLYVRCKRNCKTADMPPVLAMVKKLQG